MGGPLKYLHGDNSINDRKLSQINVYIGKVLSIDDPYDGKRIKARIYGVDNKIGDTDEALYAFPLMPKFIHVIPKVGETVLIFIQDSERKQDDRFWIGPIISQPQYLNNDPHFFTSRSLFKSGGVVAPDVAPSKLPDANGIYPTNDDVAIQGRVNTDLIFRENQIVIRAGKFVNNSPLKYNEKNPAYFKIQSNTNIIKDGSTKIKGSVATMVGDILLLLTHSGSKGNIKKYDITAANSEISEDVINDIISNGEPAVYGNILVSFCKILKQFAENHTHAYPGLPPLPEKSQQELLKFDLNTILAKNIRIV